MGIRRGEWRLGEESQGEEGLISRLQATAFSFAAAGLGKNQRSLPARVELSVPESPLVAGEYGGKMRASRSVSQPQVVAFYSVAVELEGGQLHPRKSIQFQGVAFPEAAAGSEPHSSVLPGGQVELAWLCHWLRLCGHGAAA